MSTPYAQTAELKLPTPADRPEAAVLLFDGHCRFCIAAAKKLNRLDTRGAMAFLSLHEPEIAERYPDLSHEQLMVDMYLVSPDGRRHRGAEAYRYLSTRIPRLWLLAPLLHLPLMMPVWQWIYGQVAKRRYLLFGKTPSCHDGACKISS